MPGFPDVADEHAGEKVVGRAHPLEGRVTRQRDEHAAHKLIGIPHRRSRRIGQDEERKKEDGMKIRRSKDFGDFSRIAQEAS